MILVSGATGNVGRELVEQLTATGQEVRALTRDASRARFGADVEVVEGDLLQPVSIQNALRGADGLFLISCGTESDIVARAHAAGIERMVLLSALVAQTRPDSPLGMSHRRAEQAVESSDVGWTVLRPGQFASNTLRWAEMIRTHHAVYAPFADVAQPVIHPGDIAAVAALCLTEDDHGGKTYALTGPEAVAPRSQLRTIAAALGRELEFHEISRDEARQRMLEHVVAEIADASLNLLGNPTLAEKSVLPTVEALVGRPARTFGQWAAEHVEDFR